MDEGQRLLTMQMAIKVADLGHCTLPWDQHYAWVQRLEAEFFEQVRAMRWPADEARTRIPLATPAAGRRGARPRAAGFEADGSGQGWVSQNQIIHSRIISCIHHCTPPTLLAHVLIVLVAPSPPTTAANPALLKFSISLTEPSNQVGNHSALGRCHNLVALGFAPPLLIALPPSASRRHSSSASSSCLSSTLGPKCFQSAVPLFSRHAPQLVSGLSAPACFAQHPLTNARGGSLRAQLVGASELLSARTHCARCGCLECRPAPTSNNGSRLPARRQLPPRRSEVGLDLVLLRAPSGHALPHWALP